MTLTVEFAVGDPGSCPVAAASEEGDAPVDSVSRASIRGEDTVAEEFELPADAPVDVEGVRAVGSTETASVYRFERGPEQACVCEQIEALAGPASDIRAEDGTLVVTARVEDIETVRDVVERLREGFDGVAVRRLTNLEAVTDGDSSGLDGDLTDRQREVLGTAYEMGYFEYPKGANAGEVADELDISRSTLAEHLAAALGKVLAGLVDPDGPVTPSAPRP